MLVNTAVDTLESSVDEGNEFSIKKGPHAFKILSDKLYSDKIGAIIRELCCNAADSHKEAGRNNVPFVVKLPTIFDPVFYVEDFGVGLNDADIHHLYTTYFDSTKSSSNDGIGGLGLGSKSPFAYTSEFTIRSRKDGLEGTYLCALRNGVPTIRRLGPLKQTTEHNGLRVSISVEKRAAMDEFQRKAAWRLSSFPKESYKVIGDFERIKMERIGAVQMFRDGSTNWYVKMGPVLYDLKKYEDWIPEDCMAVFSDDPIVLEFGIGELEVQPSREGVEYTPENVQKMKRRMREVISEHFKTLYLKYKGKKPTVAMAREIRGLIRGYAGKTKSPELQALRDIMRMEWSLGPGNLYSRKGKYYGTVEKAKRSEEKDMIVAAASKLEHIIHIDVDKGFVSRIQNWMLENNVVYAFAPNDFQNFKNDPGLEVIRVSDMPDVSKASTRFNYSKKVREVVKKGTIFNEDHTLTDAEIEDGFYYLWSVRNHLVKNPTDEYSQGYDHLYDTLPSEYDGKPVFILQSHNKTLAKKGTNLLAKVKEDQSKYTIQQLTFHEYGRHLEKLGFKKPDPITGYQFRDDIQEIRQKMEKEVKRLCDSVNSVTFISTFRHRGMTGLPLGDEYWEKRFSEVIKLARKGLNQA